MVLDLEQIARRIRVDVLDMSYRAKAGHIGSCLSIVDILAVLYFHVLRLRPEESHWQERDRFILSKGHAAAALYAALARRGFFPTQELRRFGEDGSPLTGHPEINALPGIEATTGSLGHGLPIGLGMALAAKRLRQKWRVFVLISDGECDEGTTWEAALAASHLGLDNLTVIIDRNYIQALGRTEDVLPLEPLSTKWESFGWNAREIDGHSIELLKNALDAMPWSPAKPNVLIARTILGKGVSFMENQLSWHYQSMKETQYQDASRQLGT